MIPLTLAEVRELAPGRLEGMADAITGVKVDSRVVEPGDLFVAVGLAAPGDVVLIAGKGAEQGQEFADRTIPFDDREAAKEALT